MTNNTAYPPEIASIIDGIFAIGLAEYHGGLTGVLCLTRPAELKPLSLFEYGDEEPAVNDVQALNALRDVTHEQLSSPDGGFHLPFPDDDTPLAIRAQALGEWCEGFLYGLASKGTLDLKKVSPDVREVVEDLAQFTRAAFDEGSDNEIEETAYAELVEYVRVGAQLVFVELSPRSGKTKSDS